MQCTSDCDVVLQIITLCTVVNKSTGKIHKTSEKMRKRTAVAVTGAVVLFHVVTWTVRCVQPLLRAWILFSSRHLYRYVLQPYALFWLDHFYILCGIVASITVFYMIRVINSTERKDPFATMDGCGDCEGCKGGCNICELHPGTPKHNQSTRSVGLKAGSRLLSHIESFEDKLSMEDVDDLRERLHSKGMLSSSDMEDFLRPPLLYSSDPREHWRVLVGKLKEKENACESVLEALEDKAAEARINWTKSLYLAEELNASLRQGSQQQNPTGYQVLSGVTFFAEETFPISPSPDFTAINWPNHGISLSIPSCSLQSEVRIKVTFSGFNLPSQGDYDLELVSPVYCITTSDIVSKPIPVQVKHCAVMEKQSDEKLLNFVVAELPNADKGSANAYNLSFHAHPDTCFSLSNPQLGSTVLPPADVPLRRTLLAVVKFKGKSWFKLFCGRNLQCSYRMKVFYSQPYSNNRREWDATIVATRDLPSYTEMLRTKYPSDRFSAGPSTVACVGEEGLSIELPTRGEATSSKWSIRRHSDLRITRQQMDRYHDHQSADVESPCVKLRLKWIGKQPTHVRNADGENFGREDQISMSYRLEPAIATAGQWYPPDLDLLLVVKGTRQPHPCRYLPLHLTPDPNGPHSSAVDEEDTKASSNWKTTGLKVLDSLKWRFRVFVVMSMEVSVPCAYVNVPCCGRKKKYIV